MSESPRPTSRRRLPGRKPYAVSALRRKYAEVMGLGDTDAVDYVGRTLLLFDPDCDLAAIRPVRPYKAHRERWTRTALAILRETGEPMTGRELARAVMNTKQADYTRMVSIEASLHLTLDKLVGQGIERVEGSPKRWVIDGDTAGGR